MRAMAVKKRRKPWKERKEHYLWRSMMARCYRKTSHNFKNYGGRGITVSKRWHVFANFFADMGVCPPGLFLDRVDNSKGYSRENCAYVTPRESAINRRSTKWLMIFGEKIPQKYACQKFGVSQQTFLYRTRTGMSDEEALITPNRRKRRNERI